MSDLIYVNPLSATDVRDVARLERTCHPRDAWQGRQQLRSLLEFVDSTGWGLNLGLFAGNRLVGYIIAHEDVESEFDAESGNSVIYADDLAIDARYRRHSPKLIGGFLRRLRTLYPEHELEAHGKEPIIDMWRRHAGFFLRNGYRLSDEKLTDKVVSGEQLRMVRWIPTARDEEPVEADDAKSRRASSEYTFNDQRYSVELITRENEWQELEPCWNSLLMKTPEPTVFQTYEYQRIWWHHFGTPRSLFILLIRENGKIVGIAPLAITPTLYFGKHFRELGFVGVNWEVDRPKLLFGDHAEACAHVTARFLHEKRKRWDLIRLYEQPENGISLSRFQSELRGYGYLTETSKDAVAPYLRTDTGWDKYYKALSKRLKKNLRSAKNRLDALGEVRYEEYTSYPEVLEKLAAYRDLEQQSWKAGAGVGPSKQFHYYRFFQDLAERFGRSGQFHLRLITLDGKPIAATFGLEHNRYFYSLHITHDNDYNKYSVGTLLESMELRSCFEGNCEEYDFLGSFLNNKLRWTSSVRTSRELHAYQKKWQLVLLYVLYLKIKPVAKDVIKSILGDKVQVLVAYKTKLERAQNRRDRRS